MKKTIRYILLSLLISIFCGCLAYALYYANRKQNSKVCKRMDIKIHREGAVYLQTEDLEVFLEKAKSLPFGKEKARINTANLEEVLQSNPYVREAEVYMGTDDVLYVEVFQREALLRVLNAYGQTYLVDKEAVLMPYNPKYPLHLRVINGKIRQKAQWGMRLKATDTTVDKKKLWHIYQLSSLLSEDEFLDAQIDQIYVDAKGEFVLVPKIGGQDIFFGSIEEAEDKLKRLKLLYKYGFKEKGWDTYKSINLKYKDQIICTKK